MPGFRCSFPALLDPPCLRQRSEQNLTCSQSRAHFLRHAKGRRQARQIFEGSFSLWWVITGLQPYLFERQGDLGVDGVIGFWRKAV